MCWTGNFWSYHMILCCRTSFVYVWVRSNRNKELDSWNLSDSTGRTKTHHWTLCWAVESAVVGWQVILTTFISSWTCTEALRKSRDFINIVDKTNQLDVTICILYFSSNSCSTCFGQPCAHHPELTSAWCYSLVLVCAVAAGRLSSPVGSCATNPSMDALPANRTWQPPCSHGTYQHEAITSRSRHSWWWAHGCPKHVE